MEKSHFDTNLSSETTKILRLPDIVIAREQEKQMSRTIGCTSRLSQFVSERVASPGKSKLLCIKTTGMQTLHINKSKMALGNKLIDSALRKARYPTVLFITRMPRRSNNRLF